MNLPAFGAHMSVAGGLTRAVDRAVIHRCDALQIFTKNASQWRARPLAAEDASAFRQRVRDSGLSAVVSHASYLINLATAGTDLGQKSRDAMLDELDRAEMLGLGGVVLHPGSATDGTPAEGVRRIADALHELLATRADGTTRILLEHTAGQGTALGSSFEQIADILELAHGHPRLGVCLDTCHLLAAGYDLCSTEGYQRTFEEFSRRIGFARLAVLHMNDSKKPLGSRVDRHTHIGQGHLGLEPFDRLVNDPRVRHLPMILETPKADGGSSKGAVAIDPLDDQNLTTLRSLVRS